MASSPATRQAKGPKDAGILRVFRAYIFKKVQPKKDAREEALVFFSNDFSNVKYSLRCLKGFKRDPKKSTENELFRGP